MYITKSTLSDVNGNLIAAGTKDIKPEQLGDKSVIARYMKLGAIAKTDSSGEEITADNVIVTGEAGDEQTAKDTELAVKNVNDAAASGAKEETSTTAAKKK